MESNGVEAKTKFLKRTKAWLGQGSVEYKSSRKGKGNEPEGIDNVNTEWIIRKVATVLVNQLNHTSPVDDKRYDGVDPQHK